MGSDEPFSPCLGVAYGRFDSRRCRRALSRRSRLVARLAALERHFQAVDAGPPPMNRHSGAPRASRAAISSASGASTFVTWLDVSPPASNRRRSGTAREDLARDLSRPGGERSASLVLGLRAAVSRFAQPVDHAFDARIVRPARACAGSRCARVAASRARRDQLLQGARPARVVHDRAARPPQISTKPAAMAASTCQPLSLEALPETASTRSTDEKRVVPRPAAAGGAFELAPPLGQRVFGTGRAHHEKRRRSRAPADPAGDRPRSGAPPSRCRRRSRRDGSSSQRTQLCDRPVAPGLSSAGKGRLAMVSFAWRAK